MKHALILLQSDWVGKHPKIFAKGISVIILTFDILMIIGAIKDWDWLYAPDTEYHYKWTTGQISRYLGRKTARICGAAAGAFILVPIGAMMVYSQFFKR